MTVNALAAGRIRDREMFDKLDCTLYPAKTAYPNARAVLIVEAPQTVGSTLQSGTYFRVKQAESSDTNSGHLDIGTFEISSPPAGSTSSTGGVLGATTIGTKVTVNLGRHVEAEWWSTNDALSGYYLGGLAYAANDQAVTSTASTNTVVGRVWGTRTRNGIKQVLVERLTAPVGTVTIASGTPAQVLNYGSSGQVVRTNSAENAAEWGGLRLASSGALTVAWTSHDYAPLAADVNAATGTVSRMIAPDGANCTITLPTTNVLAGTELTFVKREATATYTVSIVEGATTLWTGTANKRCACKCVFDGTAWGVIGTSAP